MLCHERKFFNMWMLIDDSVDYLILTLHVYNFKVAIDWFKRQSENVIEIMD